MIFLPDSQAVIVPGIAEFARGGRPALPATDDGNDWSDGLCWLYCLSWTRVMWIGRVTVAAADAPMNACAPCIRRLNDLLWEHLLLSGQGIETGQLPAPAPAPAPTSRGPLALESGQPRARHKGRHRRAVLDRWSQPWRPRTHDRADR
ncbi:hypothetical protein [Kitasatospora cineracea]|uniref:hypothetical protein n=1 Tax=Kitasatospora cineracea TaxID=88074 RepID=UPI0034000969